MGGYEYIQTKQQVWAEGRGIPLIGSKAERGKRMYTRTLEENLFQRKFDGKVRDAFEKADGNEIAQDGEIPAKMQALHSSSALALNVFQYWMSKDVSTIASACGLCRKGSDKPKQINFEVKLPVSESFRFPLNIDVVIENSGSIKAFAIECKFTEAYGRKHPDLKEKYINLKNTWDDIPNLYQLAKSISPKDNDFQHLHPAQLIKHILALKKEYGKKGFRLLYLWYDAFGEEGFRHKEEIERFAKICAEDGIMFHSLSYQELIMRLRQDCMGEHREYVRYLSERYL